MLRFLTAGESHGPALVVVVEGLPAGLPITIEEIGDELARRRLGFGRGPRMRFERDDVEFLGGVRHGLTLGSPVSIVIHNTEWPKWQEEMSPAPGRSPRSRCTSPDPGTPTSSACRSTASTTPATCSSGPAPARRPPGSPPARWPSRSSGELGTEVISHVVQMGDVPRRRRAPARRRPTSTAVDDVAGALLRPRGRGGDDRRDRGRGEGRRLARRCRRGARLRRAARARVARALGPQASTACSRRRS